MGIRRKSEDKKVCLVGKSGRGGGPPEASRVAITRHSYCSPELMFAITLGSLTPILGEICPSGRISTCCRLGHEFRGSIDQY